MSNGVAGSLQITLSPEGAQVDGRIQDQEDKPVSGATVVLIPDSRRYSLYKEVNRTRTGASASRASRRTNTKLGLGRHRTRRLSGP